MRQPNAKSVAWRSTVRKIKRGLLEVGAVITLTFAGPAAVATASSSAPAPSPSSSAPAPVWFFGSPTEPFTDQVQRTIDQNPLTTEAWITTLSGLRDTLSSGNPVSLPGNAENATQQLDQVKTALSNAELKNTSVSRSKVETTTSSVGIAANSGTAYDLRGYAINNYVTWQARTEIDGGYCTPSGCEITDVTRQTWKITPGRSGDRFSFTSIRTGGGNLSDIYANLSVLCNGSGCGTGTAGKGGANDGSGSGSVTVAHRSTAGGTLVDRVQMHAYFAPNRGAYYDSFKTGTAKCGSGSTYSCKYA